MTESKITVGVSVEAHVHRIVREIALQVYKEYGVQIESIDVDWHRFNMWSVGTGDIRPAAIRIRTVSP